VDERTAALIKQLVAEARPVRPLRPPLLRAGMWLAAVIGAGMGAILLSARVDVFFARLAEFGLAVEWTATLLTGIAAVIAAFQLSLSDRTALWALLPLPPLAVWLATSGYGCLRNWVMGQVGNLGQSTSCFLFIVGFSVPLAVSLLFVLRRAAPLAPLRVAAMGALGVAALSAAALQFFHPFDVTFLDLGVHLFAVLLVIVAGVAVESFAARRVGELKPM
jgi:Negative regulator of sigma F